MAHHFPDYSGIAKPPSREVVKRTAPPPAKTPSLQKLRKLPPKNRLEVLRYLLELKKQKQKKE